MIKKAVKMVLGILLVVVVLIIGTGIGSYLYLKPEKKPPRLVSPNTVRVVENGELVGFENQNDTHAWLGIPYAAPPAGELRWKAPRSPKKWPGRFEALDYGSECLQNSGGSEDCLYLNIWAPGAKTGSDRLPVMFWIHGGANTSGSGGDFYDGSNKSGKHDVVVVTINYRLGPFGWFRHPALRSENNSPEDNSGNYGTLDIIQALRWVQNNISVFGGDPGNVTIYGESAGGTNVLTMMASPLAKGLFHRAVVQSGMLNIVPADVAENYLDDEIKGSPLSSKEIVNNLLVNDGSAADREPAKKLQDGMGAEEIAAYVYGKSSEEIFPACRFKGAKGSKVNLPAVLGDGYVLPKGMSNSEIFSNMANYNSVPVILGSNRDETKLFMLLDDDFIDKIFGFPVGFKDEAGYERMTGYSSDMWKAGGVDSLASFMRETQGDSVFAYRFDVDDLRDLGFVDLAKLMGAAHAMEIEYVFGNFSSYSKIMSPGSTAPAKHRLSDSMMSYWAEFAYTGDPGRGRSGEEAAWTHWQNGERDRLRLMIFDTDLDRGIRMSSEWVTLEGIKAKFFAETGFLSQKAHCDAYKFLFHGDDFIQSEYENLGQGGCTE